MMKNKKYRRRRDDFASYGTDWNDFNVYVGLENRMCISPEVSCSSSRGIMINNADVIAFLSSSLALGRTDQWVKHAEELRRRLSAIVL